MLETPSETDSGATWALVLAGGEGRRLQGLTTTPAGTVIPKQYCSLRGGASLLEETIDRARNLTGAERICAVVAADAAGWWRGQLEPLPRANIVVQPRNRGTANGVLLPLLRILERDPHATLVLLPSDHYVEDERALAQALREAVARVAAAPAEIVLLGIEPDAPDPELGYILPGGAAAGGGFDVLRFVEKPAAPLARELMAAGALWNAFIIVARGRALLELFESRFPSAVACLREALRADRAAAALEEAYARLEERDFSRHILQGQEARLRVLRVPRCGWSDLGTPGRVAEVLRRSPQLAGGKGPRRPRDACLNLAVQHGRASAARSWLHSGDASGVMPVA
jgi:mannose-1-phosphate guanylyltransferase